MVLVLEVVWHLLVALGRIEEDGLIRGCIGKHYPRAFRHPGAKTVKVGENGNEGESLSIQGREKQERAAPFLLFAAD